MGSVDTISKVLGTGTTNIMLERGKNDLGIPLNRERVPPGMLSSLQTSSTGHLENLMVEACTAGKVGATSSGIRAHFLPVSEIDCLGSAMAAVVTGSMAETTLPSPYKRADL